MSQNGIYEPGTYVNSEGVERQASDAKSAVALAFNGFHLKVDEPEAPEAEEPVADPKPPVDPKPTENPKPAAPKN